MDIKYEAGTYRLMNDVTNRTPDRRRKYDWQSLPQWDKDTVFFVDHDGEGHAFLRVKGFNPMWAHDERFNDIYVQLEKVDETPRLYLQRVHNENLCMYLLDRLHANGTITLDQIKEVLKQELDDVE